MLKKLVSASLSLTMLISAAAGDCFNSLIAEKSSNNRHSSSDSNETQLKGQNSFGKYIERTSSKDKEEGIKPLSLKADSDNFKVSKIDFDIESGKLTVVTTQGSACTLKVEFIDDDDPNNVYELKTGVKAGEKVETVLSVDKGQLPEFFKVRAVLTDTYGNELGNPFSLSKYMRFMQELDKATVNDYNEEYVVNLDADETTNFLVLNEETIMAESTEEENTLVSADYDNDVYVFENINDSIRYLSAGDYFYAQPNEKDMVAVNIESIDIDGDTATIRGGGEVDDMFEVIKIEVGSDEIDTSALENDNVMDDVMINGVTEEENDEYSIAYNGTAEDESGEHYLEYSVLKYSDTNTPQSNFKLFDVIKKAVDKVDDVMSIPDDGYKVKIPVEFQIGSAKRKENGEIELDEFGNKKINTIGKDFINTKDGNKHLYSNDEFTADVKCGFEITAKFKLTFETNITFYKYKKELEFGWDGSIELKLEVECSAKLEVSFDLVKIPIPTPIPGLALELGCTFKFGIEASITISAGYKSLFGYHFIRYADGSTESRKGNDTDKEQKKQENKFEVKGKFYIELTPSIGISVISSKFLCAKLEFPVKFEAKVNLFTLKGSSYDSNDETWSFDNLSDGDLSSEVFAIPDPGNVSKYEPLHACPICIKIEPSVTAKLKISFKFPFIKKLSVELLEKKWEWEPWHRSILDKEGLFFKGECDHYLYGTDLHIIGNNDISAAGLVVEIEGKSQQLTGGGDTVLFFLEPHKWFTYKIYSKGELIKTDEIFNSGEYNKYDIYLDGGTSQVDSVPVTTTTAYTEPPEPHTVTSAIGEIIEKSPEHLMVEYGVLGDNITYSLYPDGFLYIFGYGPMNRDDDPIQNKELVKNVLMEDYATYMRKQLKSEAAEETVIDEYTERNQEELCGKYLAEHKDRIVNALNENYNVDRNDPDLDEMVDDYLYANAEDLAHEYFNEHSDEYADAIESFKEDLIAESEKRVITSIGNSVFEGCENLESITYEESPNEGKKAFDLPKTLTSIGAYAFKNCKKLDFGNVVFDNKIKSIGYGAFENCYGITNVKVPESVQSLGGLAFRCCSSLETAVIESDTHEMGHGIFFGCNELKELTLPESVKIIGDPVVEPYGLNNLFHNNINNVNREAVVPDSLKKVTLLRGDTIHYKAFDSMGKLEIIAIPEGIKTIEDDAFYSLGTLQKIICTDETKDLSFSELFRNLESIGKRAFMSCTALQIGDLVLGENLKLIDMQAFQGDIGITGLYIPESVTWIGSSAFENCTALKKAVLKSSAEDYRGLFYNTNSMEELVLPAFITIRGNHDLKRIFRDNNESNEKEEVPETLKKVSILSGDAIPDGALDGFGRVETIGLPTGIKSIGKQSLQNEYLKNIICSDETKDLSVSELLKDVETIDENAFSGCKVLQIGKLEFGSKLKSIGQHAFNSCNGITELYIPANAESFGFMTFGECASLEKIVIDTEAPLSAAMFYGCTALYEMTLPCFNKVDSYHGNYLRYVFYDHNERWPYESADVLKKLTFKSGEKMPVNYLDGFSGLTVLGLPEELSVADVHATQDLGNLEEIIYSGTDEDWDNIDIREQNDPLLKAKRTKPAAEEHLYGDANGDGIVDMSDAVMIMQALCNPNKFGINGTDPNHITEAGWKFADADGNGLTVGDALRIQQYLLGIIPSLV